MEVTDRRADILFMPSRKNENKLAAFLSVKLDPDLRTASLYKPPPPPFCFIYRSKIYSLNYLYLIIIKRNKK